MKKVTLAILAALVITTLVATTLAVRYSRRILAAKPIATASSSLPSVAWIDGNESREDGALLFDLHRVATYPMAVNFPSFSTPSGWSIRESSGTWAMGNESIVDFRLLSAKDRTLVLNTNPTGDLFKKPQFMTVTLNGNEIGRSKISRSQPLSTFRMPARGQLVGTNRLVFEFDHTVKPLDRWGGGNDTRPLAAWIRNITLLEGSSGEIAATLRTIKMFSRLDRNRRMLAAQFTQKQRLVVRDTGRIIVALGGNERPELALEIRPPGAGSSLAVKAHNLAGETAEAAVIGPTKDKRPTEATLQLPEHFDTAFLEIDVNSIDAERPLRLTAPWLSSLATPAKTPPMEPKSTETSAFNIVVLILDAARAADFGCYGSERATTPNIDALAAEAIVFPEVVALAPYTLCSVPTMATGLSFLDHGVVERGQSLSPATTTLAEVLQAAGYRTAAFSATPNNSKKLGVAQGYQIFEEAWKGVARGPALDPHRLVGLAEAWLDDQPHDSPYHLMLHMVPPHEPYEPGPEFDRFSDPDYQGPANGSREFIDLFNNNPRNLTQADLDQTKDLYDGNLLKADDAVGHLIRTLNQRKDWDRTAVLITSDHGEALGEHGRIGHNAQVFEEMIRVPFILKLPKAIESPDLKVISQAASLADLAPTMAGLAGLGFPDPMSGRNLLSSSAAAIRPMVIRTAHERPTFALRTPRWKLVVQNATELDLFDLLNDPEEKADCADSHPVVAAGLRQVLLSHLAAAPLFTTAEEAGLTGQDEEMLRTLGYLE